MTFVSERRGSATAASEIEFLNLGIGLDLLGRTLFEDPPVVHHRHALDHREYSARPLLSIGEPRDEPVLDRRQMDGLNERIRGLDERVAATGRNERVAAARNAATREIDIVENGQAREKRGDLV